MTASELTRSFLNAAIERAALATSAEVDAFCGQLESAQDELATLRGEYPEWSEEIDRIVEQFDVGDPEATRQAFEDLDALMADRRKELREAEVSSKVARANLLYPFEISKAEPLLCAVAYLDDQNFWYWIECGGPASTHVGDLGLAQAAFLKASETAQDRDPTGK